MDLIVRKGTEIRGKKLNEWVNAGHINGPSQMSVVRAV
jgi:hypothetical protein